MYNFFEVLKERLRDSDWYSLSDCHWYSNDFKEKSEVLFDYIKRNRKFRDTAHTIVKNFENQIGWQFFDSVSNHLSRSNHEQMFRDVEKIMIKYVLKLIKYKNINDYSHPAEKAEKNKLEKIETQMKRKINHIEKLKLNLQNSDFFAKKLDKILK